MSLIDLDELVLRCRDEEARMYITEAVACYKAGAFRSAIVSTWNAVVFDFLHKLRELDLIGDKNARRTLKEFETIRSGGLEKLKEALAFERQVLDVASDDFELLTLLEKIDLERLQADRNRCAHPSMQSTEEPYQPTAELARTHIRNAVEILLQREPVQGKAALDRIFAEIRSEYFPQVTDKAKEHFEPGLLRRARKPLVRSLVIGLTKQCLKGGTRPSEFRRARAALAAIVEMHWAFAEEVLQTQMPHIAGTVEDEELWRLVNLAAFVPGTWEAMGVASQNKVRALAESILGDAKHFAIVMVSALRVKSLRPVVRKRLDKISLSGFERLLAHPSKDFMTRAIRELREADSFRSAEHIGREVILALGSVMTADNIRDVLAAIRENAQAYAANDMPSILCEFFDLVESHHAATKRYWQEFQTFVLSFDDNGDGVALCMLYTGLVAKVNKAYA